MNSKPFRGILLVLLTSTLLPLEAQVSDKSKPENFPRYDRTVMLETTSETSANVAFGDLDGDGNLDIALAKRRHWPLVNRVLLGDGKGDVVRSYDLGVRSAIFWTTRRYRWRCDLDVIVSNDRPDAKLVYLNDGKGFFGVGSKFGRTDWPTRNASVVDLNNDGLPDIVVANRSRRKAGANYLCINKGKGRFDADCIAFSHYPATTITPADFNGDGLSILRYHIGTAARAMCTFKPGRLASTLGRYLLDHRLPTSGCPKWQTSRRVRFLLFS